MRIPIISIDTNHNHDGFVCPTISPFTVNYFQLRAGDKIIGYQDDQEWEGILMCDPTFPEEMEWYLDLNNSIEHAVSEEKMKGRQEGSEDTFPYGEILGEMSVVTAMLADGMEVEVVLKYTRLSRTRVEKIKRRLTDDK